MTFAMLAHDTNSLIRPGCVNALVLRITTEKNPDAHFLRFLSLMNLNGILHEFLMFWTDALNEGVVKKSEAVKGNGNL
jgi:hypothetical protein